MCVLDMSPHGISSHTSHWRAPRTRYTSTLAPSGNGKIFASAKHMLQMGPVWVLLFPLFLFEFLLLVASRELQCNGSELTAAVLEGFVTEADASCGSPTIVLTTASSALSEGMTDTGISVYTLLIRELDEMIEAIL